jgi:hypothetical protein
MLRFIRMELLAKIFDFYIKLMSGSMIHTELNIMHLVFTFSQSELQLNYCSYRFSLEHLQM